MGLCSLAGSWRIGILESLRVSRVHRGTGNLVMRGKTEGEYYQVSNTGVYSASSPL